jgi:cysteinyl-tRNA synthetase
MGLAGGLGFLGFSNVQLKIAAKPKMDTAAIAHAIAARNEARKAKNFAESDRIRDELLAKGIVLKDGPQGTSWEIQK